MALRVIFFLVCFYFCEPDELDDDAELMFKLYLWFFELPLLE